MAIQFTANLTGETYHYYPVPGQSQYQHPYWKLFDEYTWSDYTIDFFFKNTPGTDNYVEGNYGTFPMLTTYKNNDREDPRYTYGLVRWSNTNIFAENGIPHSGFGYGVLGLGDNKNYRLRLNKPGSYGSDDYLTDLDTDTTTSWHNFMASSDDSTGTLELFSYSIGVQFQGLDFYDLNGILVKSFRSVTYDGQDYLYESVEDKYYGPDGSNPVDDPSPAQPTTRISIPKQLLLFRRRLFTKGTAGPSGEYTGGYTFGGTLDKNGNSISVGNPFSGDNVSDGFLDAFILNDTSPSYILFSTDNPCHPTTLRYWSGWHAAGEAAGNPTYASLTLYGDNNGTWVEVGSWTNVSRNRFFRSDLAIPTYTGNYTNWRIRMDGEYARVCGNFTFDSSLPPITSQVISSYSQISMNGRNQGGDINSIFDQEWEWTYWQRSKWSSAVIQFTCTEPVIGIRVIRRTYPINYNITANGISYGDYSADSGLNLFGNTIPASTPITISFSQAGYSMFSVSDIVPAIRGPLP